MKESLARMNERDAALDKYLSPVDVWAIAFGCIVGWGAFVMPGTTFLPIAGPIGTVIAMAVSTVIMLVIGRNYSYLMTTRPGTGGVYAYTKEIFGRDHAFLCSWFLSLSYTTIVFLNATALFVICRTVFGDALQFGFHYVIAGYDIYFGEIALTAGALALIGLLFVLMKPFLQLIQTILAVVLLAGVVIIMVSVIPHISEMNWRSAHLTSSESLSGILTIILLAPWAFVGFDVASLETAHFRFSAKRSGRIITLSILLGGFAYIALSVVSAALVPEGYSSLHEYIKDLDSLKGIEAVPAFFAAYRTMGSTGIVIMSITALAAILTGIIAAFRGSARVLSTMAEDKILSDKFLRTTFSILFIMVISIIISFLGRNALNWFVDLTSFGAIIGFGYTSACAARAAKKDKNELTRATGIIGTGISVLFAFTQLISKLGSVETMGAQSFLLLAVWCLVGFVFYWRTMRQSALSDYNGITTSSTVLFCLLLYSVLMWFAKSMTGMSEIKNIRSFITARIIVVMVLVLLGLVVMLYIQGMLQRKHAQLQREKIHAEESSKAKTQFLFNMSHDIRTPMNAIIGYTHLAEHEENVPPKIQEYIEKIDISGKHLLTLINDILEMSRIESGNLELHEHDADILETAETAFDMFRRQMEEKNIAYELVTDVSHPYAIFDRTRLLRVILNLLSNAYKFTPNGGRVTLTLKQLPDDGADKASYMLSVKDNGIGMNKEFAETVFEAFARERTSTVSKTQGTGLGMAISKNIIDAMGGGITVDTEPDKGTQFTVELTLDKSQKPENTAPQPASPTNPDDLKGKKLLLVEDNEINMRLAKMILSKFGCETDTAENGKAAVDIISSSKRGDYDAVLMDIQMPVMDGYEATRQIRALDDKELAQIPIIAMTANAFAGDIKAAENAGMQAHISKPLDVDKMISTLTEVLSQGADSSAREDKYV